tara:strand:+ start:303 stop:506 length:204 start_codon:yes stop_codon:yes gene_type:complete
VKTIEMQTGIRMTPAEIVMQLQIEGMVMNDFVRYDADKGWQFAVKQENNKIITINCNEQKGIVSIVQ